MMALDAMLSIELEKLSNRVGTDKDLQFNPSPKDGPQVGSFKYPKLEPASDNKAYSPRAEKPHLNYSSEEKKEEPSYKYGSSPNILNAQTKVKTGIHEGVSYTIWKIEDNNEFMAQSDNDDSVTGQATIEQAEAKIKALIDKSK